MQYDRESPYISILMAVSYFIGEDKPEISIFIVIRDSGEIEGDREL